MNRLTRTGSLLSTILTDLSMTILTLLSTTMSTDGSLRDYVILLQMGQDRHTWQMLQNTMVGQHGGTCVHDTTITTSQRSSSTRGKLLLYVTHKVPTLLYT